MKKELLNKIKECIIYHPELGGRSVLEIDIDDAEEIIKLTIDEYHNSKCPECGNNVSCVCTSKCKHIWYCPKHVLNHKHRKHLNNIIKCEDSLK